jgi:predicted protein tyrosine phosphatase
MSTHKPNILVTNINEAYLYAHDFDSVITAGPQASEVANFNHPDHLVVEFHDIIETRYDNGWIGPTQQDVARMLEWAFERFGRSILIHCHAGMSRSTATAIGVLTEWGYDEDFAFKHVEARRPVDAIRANREFIPNPLILSHVDRIVGSNLLAARPEYARELLQWGNPNDYDELMVAQAASII